MADFWFLPSNTCFWQGVISWETRFKMSKFFQYLQAWEMRVYFKAPSFVQLVDVTKPMGWILKDFPLRQTHTPSSVWWLCCSRGWGFPHLSGWRAESMDAGMSYVVTGSPRELVGTFTELQVCRWQSANPRKPTALHSFGEILTRLQWTFCFRSYSLHDLSGEIKLNGIDWERGRIGGWNSGRNWSWVSPKRSPCWISEAQRSLLQITRAMSRAVRGHVWRTVVHAFGEVLLTTSCAYLPLNLAKN